MSLYNCPNCGELWKFHGTACKPKRQGSFAAPHGYASGPATPEKRSLEPWILETARELAMDSAHITSIAQIIQKHAPPHSAKLTDGATL